MSTVRHPGQREIWSWDAWSDDRSFGGVTDLPDVADRELCAAMDALPGDAQGFVRKAFPTRSGFFRYGEPVVVARREARTGALVIKPG